MAVAMPCFSSSAAQMLHHLFRGALFPPTTALMDVIYKPFPPSQFISHDKYLSHRFHPSSSSIKLPTSLIRPNCSTSGSLSALVSHEVEETTESLINVVDILPHQDDDGEPLTNKKMAEVRSNLPSLTVKEKKELASLANGMGKKLKCQSVGKSGITSNVAASFIETLEANELLKIKFHNTCPGDLGDVVQQLQQSTGSVVVGQIGRTVIIYRPSLAKLKTEEEKKKSTRTWKQNNFVRRENDDRSAPKYSIRKASSPRGRIARTKGKV